MWLERSEVAPGIWRSEEPAVDPMFRAALVTVRGRDADLQVDFGCGIVPLAGLLPLSGAPVIAVATHAHVDHIGGFHAFADRRGHAAEAAGFAGQDPAATFEAAFRDWPDVVTRPPHPGWRAADWHLPPAPLTAALAEGDRIDLGDRVFTVLHLPGHSPGGIGLFDAVDGVLISGDAIYDARLIDDLPGASVPDYIATMKRLRGFECRLAIGGHGPVMDGPRLRALAEAYLRRKGASS